MMGEKYTRNIFQKHLFQVCMTCLLLFGGFLTAHAQQKGSVKVSLDTLAIKIGEQIQYTISVETDSTSEVHFPEGQTFSPLETVEALLTDTLRKKDRVVLQRIYALTQFDSGTYTIPPQRVAINEQPFFTDSFRIKVADVGVDTTKQKMFDIKPLIQVDKSLSKFWWILLYVLLGLLVVAAAVYWFYFREKPLTEEEKEALLPPYDRALLELKRLETSKYLIQDEFKQYYSELTDIVRSYLEEDVQVSALESTTDELIDKLELLKDAGELDLDVDTIQQFRKILQTADLVKFARSKPSSSVAEQDRQMVQLIVEKTHDALPEPTEEDLLEDMEYLEELVQKQRRRQWYWAAGIFAGILVLGTVFSIVFFGSKTVRDTVFGYPTKTLLEGEWVSSAYGYPPIELQTPEVLIRQEEASLSEEMEALIKELQTFSYGKTTELFYVSSRSMTFKEAQEEVDFEKVIGSTLKEFESQGVRNIITKQEEFFTRSGVTGLKTFGSGKITPEGSSESVKAKYNILTFGGKAFMQQVVITWEDGDEYAEEIVKRILNTLEVKTQA
ncbi:MAG: hypothetical protein AAGL34_10835 [Bacteroidota bacterium]